MNKIKVKKFYLKAGFSESWVKATTDMFNPFAYVNEEHADSFDGERAARIAKDLAKEYGPNNVEIIPA